MSVKVIYELSFIGGLIGINLTLNSQLSPAWFALAMGLATLATLTSLRGLCREFAYTHEAIKAEKLNTAAEVAEEKVM